MGKKQIEPEVEFDTNIRQLITAELKAAANGEDPTELSGEEQAEIVDEIYDIIASPTQMLIEGLVEKALIEIEAIRSEEEEEDDENEDEDDDDDEE